MFQSYKQLLAGDDLLAETVRHHRDFRAWLERAANVAVLSVRLGVEMKLNERKCLVLGLCGLMHDVGMLKIPSNVLESSVIKVPEEPRPRAPATEIMPLPPLG